MPYLLDTHILLWWLGDHPKLSKTARKLIENQQNSFFVSSVTAWEISIKKALGKLEAPDELEKALFENNFLPLSITIPHALTAGKLPKYHLDPFDRMLVSQAKVENLTILTHDPIFKKYPINIILV